MQRIFSALKRLNNLLILVSVGLLVSSLFMFAPTSMAAAPISTGGQKMIQQERMDKESQAANNREQAYEEQIEAEKDPDKVYEENLKSYEASHPGENPIQKAEKLVEKVTGNN